MPQGYHHLTRDQRCQIFILLQGKHSQNYIAKSIGVGQSAICKELKRNRFHGRYDYERADEKARRRQSKKKPWLKKITGTLRIRIATLLKQRYSPEQISGRLKLDGIGISTQAIYNYFGTREQFNRYFRRKRKPYLKRAGICKVKIKNRKGIELRPAEVAAKIRVGDFEADTIVGKHHRSAILSLVDRRTKLVKLRLLLFKSAHGAAAAMIEALAPLKGHLHTITSDNGSEFAEHEQVATELAVGFYFARPYRSWERGLNENTNGLVRQYFPKGTDFSKISAKQVLAVERQLNNRPRKTLGFRTPNEVFSQLTGFEFPF